MRYWLGASAVLGRPVPVTGQYPHICHHRFSGQMTGRTVYLTKDNCAACAEARQPQPVSTTARPGYRALVTGSRTWPNPHVVTRALTDLRDEHGENLVIVHGACPRGVDAITADWCDQAGVATEEYPADWHLHGRAGGMRRNADMVATRPDLCLAFIHHRSPGATGCADLAEAAGIPTTRHHNPAPHSGGPGQNGGTSMALRTPSQALLRTALDHAARGWHVFPLRPGDKRPAFPDHDVEHCTGADPRCAANGAHLGWEPRATVDPDRIRRAWSRAPYNIGIACGPSGLLVVDLDRPKPGQTPPASDPPVRHGSDVFGWLCARHTDDGDPRLWTTYTVTTASGGSHLYYHQPQGVELRNTSGERGNGLGWLVDTRGHGGYVVAAGSTVDANPYTVARDVEPVDLSDWLTDLLRPAPLPPQQPVVLTVAPGRRGRFLDAAIRSSLDAIAAAGPAGTLNTTLYGASVALGQLIAGGALDADETEALLLDAAVRAGHPPAGARRTIRSGFRAGANRPRTVAA